MKKILLLITILNISILTSQNYIQSTPKNQTVSGEIGKEISARVRINAFGNRDEAIHFSITPLVSDNGLRSINPNSGVLAKPGDLRNIEFKFKKNVNTTQVSEYKFKIENVLTRSSEVITIRVSYGSSSCMLNSPTGLKTAKITSSSARLVWNAAANASGYQYQFRRKNITAWSTGKTITSTVVSINIRPGEEYIWRVRARCSSGNYSTRWSSIQTFRALSDCTDHLEVSENINSNQKDEQSAKISITATNVIQNEAIVNYDAGEKVYLKPGFEVVKGGKFKGFIEGCSTTSKRLLTREDTLEKKKLQTYLEQEKPNTILVYPNPFNKRINIKTDKKINNWIIYNLSSQRVVSGISTTINTSSLSKGQYIIHIHLDSGEILKKSIVKE